MFYAVDYYIYSMAVSRKQVLFPIDDYDLDLRDILGKGAFGIVYKGSHRRLKTPVAIKNVAYKEGNRVNEYLVNMGNNELEIFRQLRDHVNIVQLLHNLDDGEANWIVMEYCDLGDLPHYLQNETPILAQKLKIMYESTSAIAYMHSFNPPIVHRDIKPQNVLMIMKENQHVAKITDFGMGKLLESSPAAVHNTMSTLAGTASYMAPEFYDGGYLNYNPSVDVFSLGLLFHILLDYDGTNQSLIPLSTESIRSKKVIYFGQEMSIAIKTHLPLPKLFEDPPLSDSPVHQVQCLIRDMVKYNDKDRTHLQMVKDKIVDIYTDVLWEEAAPSKLDYEVNQLKIDEFEEKLSLLKEKDAEIMHLQTEMYKQSRDQRLEMAELQRQLQQQQDYIQDLERNISVTDVEKKTPVPIGMVVTNPEKRHSREQYQHQFEHGREEAKELYDARTITAQTKPTDKWLCGGKKIRSTYEALFSSIETPMNGKEIFQIKGFSYRFSIVKTNFWISVYSTKAIYIVSDKGETIRKITYKNHAPYSVQQASDTETLLACKEGLFVADTDGQIKYNVKDGYCTDLSISGNTVVAYEYNSNSILVCNSIQGSRWNKQHIFEVTEVSQGYLNTVNLHNNTVAVCSFRCAKVYTYSLTGDCLNTYKPSQLPRASLYISGTDCEGNVVVSDEDSNCFHVLSTSCGCNSYHLESLSKPRDLVMDNEGSLWLLSSFLGKTNITKYKKV